jgi:amino acid permease
MGTEVGAGRFDAIFFADMVIVACVNTYSYGNYDYILRINKLLTYMKAFCIIIIAISVHKVDI